jgi:hypothetical protein
MDQNTDKTDIKHTKVSPKDTLELLQGGKHFSENPDHVLGSTYETTNQFNRAVTKVKGSMNDVVNGIDVSLIAENQATPLETKVKPSLSKLLEDESALSNIRKVLLDYRKTTEASKDAEMGGNISFDEIIEAYNKELSTDEIQAWIWYKRKTGGFNDERVILRDSNGWSKYVIQRKEEQRYIDQWLRQGVVCYFNGDFIPSVLYYAENIYQRQSQLIKDKDYLDKTFGIEQFKRQSKGLAAVKPEQLSLTDPVVDNRLVIKLISEFASDIKIDALSDGTGFKSLDRSTNVTKTLPEAFIIWLGNLSPDEFKRTSPYEINALYFRNRAPARRYDKEERLRMKQNAKDEGEQLFSRFLAEALTEKDQVRIELLWNSRYNGYVSINYFKIPIGFECSRTFKNKPLFVRPAQRDGIGFLAVHGSGCIAYDVGVGKTMTGILAIAQAMESGMCKRPFIVVPNQTYKNWLTEISGLVDKKGKVELTGILPQYQVNDLYNLGSKYIDSLRNKEGVIQAVPEYSISVITYDGMRKLGFTEQTWNDIGVKLFNILNQGVDGARAESKLNEKIEEIMGRGVEGSEVNVEDLGFDFMLSDEAHAMKKIFTQVKGASVGESKRETSRYKIQSGQPSSIALKGFMLGQYIQSTNQNKNVVLLTATPFTNSPLEIYSMLSLIGYHRLKEASINNLQGFFNQFIKSSMMLIINAKMKPERKEVVLGFQNLVALQQLIFRFIDYKSGEDANIQRPNKWVLPLTHIEVDNESVPLPIEQQVSTNLPMTIEQRTLMDELEQYVTGEMDFDDFCTNASGLEEDSETSPNTSELLDESNMSDEEQEGARVLRGISFGRQIALSPYLFSCNRIGSGNPTYQQYIESSPKLKYVMGCIETVKEYHESHDEEMSGQVIYMNAGISFFPLIKDYLVHEIGFDSSEIAFIIGGMNAQKKDAIKDKFQSGKVKVLLGSQAIREGINLQNRATVLYDLWLDWNPTDLKQLEGRIWRFGNQFANVRIVIPLIENSIDVAIFQKLEEKTNRINEIWNRAGKENTLKLEEFNPAELKMGLITNPRILAEITLMEDKEILQDEITRLENQVSELDGIVQARTTFQNHIGAIEASVNMYKPLKEDQSPRTTETVLRIFKTFIDDPETSSRYMDEVNFQATRKAYNLLKRATERILEPRGLDIHFNQEVVLKKIQEEIVQNKENLELKTGKEAQEKLTNEIIEEREKSGYQPKPVIERVKEFASLNDKLLSERMIYEGDASISSRNERIQLSDDYESTDDLLEEMEKLLKDTEEMEQLMNEMKELERAA